MNTNSTSVLSATNLSYQHAGGQILTFPDLTLAPGEALLVLGASGCGKTTLLHLLAGLLRPQTGKVVVAGHTLDHAQPDALDRIRGRHLGVVYQSDYFIDTLTAWRNLCLSPFRRSDGDLKRVAHELGIEHLLQKYPQAMSAGERQRLGIARALAHAPNLILADEPTSALDRKNCLAVVELLQTQAKRENAALLIVTHDDRVMEAIPNQITLQASATVHQAPGT